MKLKPDYVSNFLYRNRKKDNSKGQKLLVIQFPFRETFYLFFSLTYRVVWRSFDFDPHDIDGQPFVLETKYENDSNKNFNEKWRKNQENIPKEVDHFFLLIMSIIIFFMQCGFAFMEAGAVR